MKLSMIDIESPAKPVASALAIITAAAAVLALSGCAASRTSGDLDAVARSADGSRPALQRLRKARAEQPGNLRLQTALHRQLASLVTQYLREADEAIDAGDESAATDKLRSVLEEEPGNRAAKQKLDQLDARKHLRVLLEQAGRLAQSDPVAASRQVQKALDEDPSWPVAVRMRDDLLRRIGESRTLTPVLNGKANRAVSLNYRSASLITIFDAISKMSGINFIFDNEVSKTATASIFAAKTTAADAIKLLLASNQLREKVLNDNTILIYPARPAKDREYRDVAVKTFFLSHATAKAISGALKTIMKSKDLYVDERMNAVVMRDAPDTIALAERLVLALDRPEAEVTLDVQVLEVQSKDLKDVGIAYPKSIGFGVELGAGGDGSRNDSTRLPLNVLGALSAKNLYLDTGSTAIALRLLQEAGDTRMLANPKIRVKNGRKAIVDVGERIPVLTTVTTDIGSSGKVDYQDVGVKFEVVPTVSLDGDISIDISLTVSSLGLPQEREGFKYYAENKRQAKTVLSARNNETRILAGLIKRNESTSTTGLPWLSRIPWLGNFFGTTNDDQRETEIVLVITPHIERSVDLPGAHVSTFIAGTEARSGEGLRLRSTGHASVTSGNASGEPAAGIAARESNGSSAFAPSLPPLPPSPDALDESFADPSPTAQPSESPNRDSTSDHDPGVSVSTDKGRAS